MGRVEQTYPYKKTQVRSLNLFDTALCLMVYRQRLERLGTEFLAFLTRSSDGSSGARNTITTSQRGWNYSKLHRHIPQKGQDDTMLKYGSSDSAKEKLSKVCLRTIIILGVTSFIFIHDHLHILLDN